MATPQLRTSVGPAGITSGTGHFNYLTVDHLKSQSSIPPNATITLMGYSSDGNLISIDSTKLPDSINLAISFQSDQQIVYTFEYPPQILIGSISIPSITSIVIEIANVNGNVQCTKTHSTFPYIKTDNKTPLQKIIIQNQNDVQDVLSSDNATCTFYCATNGTLKITYNTTYTTKAYPPLSFSYTSPNPNYPTPTLINITNSFGVTCVTGTYYSLYSDQTGSNSMLSYKVNIESTVDTVCYGFSTGTTGFTGSYESGTGSINQYNFANLIPETTYKITASAANSIYNPSTGPTGITNRLNSTGGPTGYISFTTSSFSNGLTTTNTNMNATSSGSVVLARNLNGSTGYIFKGDGNIMSDVISIPINSFSTRGTYSKNSQSLVTIKGTITNGSNTYSTPQLTFGGFNSTGDITGTTGSYINTTTKYFSINATKVDAYTGTSSVGFYLNANTQMTVPENSLLSGSNTLTITANYPQTDISKTYTYQNILYEGPYPSPSFDPSQPSFSFNNNTGTGMYICGIYIFQILPTISFNTTVTKLGTVKNYYNGKQLVDFTITPTTFSIAPITELPTPTPPPTSLSSVIFSNTLTLKPNTSTYTNSISVVTNVYNAINLAGNSDPAVKLPIVYDINSILIPKILEIFQSATPVEGCRIETISGGNEMATPFSSANITTSPLFDNTKSLSSSSELLYANGMYVAPSGTTSEKYYIDYSSTYTYPKNANPDYSSVSSTSSRYVTFAWMTKVPNCSTIIFTLKNASKTNQNYFDTNFNLFYRIEDSSSLTTLGLANSTEKDVNGEFLQNYYGTTNWILGSFNTQNITNITNINGANYTSTDINGYGYISSVYKTDVSFTVTIPSQNSGTLPTSSPSYYYIYCRIELKSDFSFSTITAQIQ